MLASLSFIRIKIQITKNMFYSKKNYYEKLKYIIQDLINYNNTQI